MEQLSLDLQWPEACQRWRDGETRWRSTRSVIDPSRYTVRAIGERCAKGFVEDHHYSGRFPASRLRFGLFEDGRRLVGVAVFSVPAQAAVLTHPFPQLKPYAESLELGRFVLVDSVAGNGETFFLARAFRLARDAGIRGVVSFSDPVPRTDCRGRTTFVGHRGTIYLASNCIRAGRSTPRTLLLLPDGSVLSGRTLSKLRNGETGRAYAGRQLEQFGASCPPADGTDRAAASAWLKASLDEIGVRRLPHPGNHRFLFALDRSLRGPATERGRILQQGRSL